MNISQKHRKKLGVSISTWQNMKRQTIKMFGTRCVYCDEECIIGDTLTIDHIIPRALGGKTKLSNLAPACKLCNELKDNKIWQMLTDD